MFAISVEPGHAFQSPQMIRFSAKVVSHARISLVSARRFDCVTLSNCVDVKLIVRPFTEIVASTAARPAVSRREPVAMKGNLESTTLPMPDVVPCAFTKTLYQ